MARRTAPAGCAVLQCEDDPSTFGLAVTDGMARIVWHYHAFSEVRTFTIRYTLVGLATAYDDVVDVNLKVWGDQWDQGLGRLRATTIGCEAGQEGLGPSRLRPW